MRIMVQGQAKPKKKVHGPHLNRKKLGMVVCVSNVSYGRKLKIGRSQSRQAWAKK
jgi:hypothetical protein